MNAPTAPRRLPRRSILVAAGLAGIVAAALLPCREDAAEAGFPPHVAIVGAASAADAPAPPNAPEAPPAPPPPSPSGKDADAGGPTGAEITIDEKGIRIEKSTGGTRKQVIVKRGDGGSDLAGVPEWVGMVAVAAVLLVFLVPLVAIALVVGYKMRRTRMLNETLQKFADKGVAPPPEVLYALGGSAAAAEAADRMQSTPPGTAQYDVAKAARKRAAWSDLRKGVIAGGIGLGLTLYSLIEDQTANGLGLVLLFVGVGYIVLWYFEDPGARSRSPGGSPPGGV